MDRFGKVGLREDDSPIRRRLPIHPSIGTAELTSIEDPASQQETSQADVGAFAALSRLSESIVSQVDAIISSEVIQILKASIQAWSL